MVNTICKFVPVPRQVGLAWPGAADVPAGIKRGNYMIATSCMVKIIYFA